MTVLKICYYGHPALRKKAKPVEKITQEIRKYIQDMLDTVKSHENCIGLAANQVGLLYRIFIVCYFEINEDGSYIKHPPKVFINPKLSNPSKNTQMMDESCMSLPDFYGPVERPYKVTIEAMDENGVAFKEELEGFFARQVMHENDHINGMLLIDRFDSKTKKKTESVLKELKKAYRIHNEKYFNLPQM
jgi:peptide deformylase